MMKMTAIGKEKALMAEPHFYSPISFLRLLLLGLLALAVLKPSPVSGQKPKENPLAPKAPVVAAPQPEQPQKFAAHELTASDVEAFLDGVMPLQLAREDIAGAVISVVKDGKVLFAKGYGYSDVEKKVPVSPKTTLFRPGSISKTFTWTALMQQVELGKVDLDHDVNEYIDFKIPATYPEPVTVRNVMTHTPGFEESVEELFVGDAKHLYPIGDWLKQHIPGRIYPPGTIPAYSNYGATLAGYIVQRVSGEPFEQYADDHIFKPLGMEHSTFRQPLPSALEPMMSKGYELGSGPAKPFENVESTPAGSCSVTAMDMTHFMIAHLQNGRYENVQILRPETAKLMHARQYALRPEINGMALGFYEESRNGQRIIGHGGDTQYFHSDMHLLVDSGVGFFISYNSAGKGEISGREAVWHRFLDRYFPYEASVGVKPATAAQDGGSVAGRYISSRGSKNTILKALGVAGQAKVSVNPDGTISVNELKDLNGQPKKLSEVGSLLYRDVNGQDRAAFVDKAGYKVLAFDFPAIVLLKAPWNENGAFQIPLIIGALTVFLLTLIFWPVGAILRRHYGHPLNLEARDRRIRLLVRVVCVLDLAFLLSFAGFFTAALNDIGMLSPRYDPLLRIIQLVGWLGLLGGLIVIYNMVRSWTQPQRWLWSKLGDTLLALACVGFTWFVFTWNLLNFSLKY
jgi:CubicO group peptidase (beta-lactamase class C family)